MIEGVSASVLFVAAIAAIGLYATACIYVLFRLIDKSAPEPLPPAPPDDHEEAARCAERYVFLRDHGPMCRPPIGIYWMQSGQILMGDSADAMIDDAIRQKRGQK